MNNKITHLDITASLSEAAAAHLEPKKPKKQKFIKDYAEAVHVKELTFATQLCEYLQDGMPYSKAIEATSDFFDPILMGERLFAPQKPKRPITKDSIEYYVKKFRAVDAQTYIQNLIPALDFFESYALATQKLNEELADPDYLYKKLRMERPVKVEQPWERTLRNVKF